MRQVTEDGIKIVKTNIPTTSLFESFGFLNYFLPLNLILDAFCPIIYFHNHESSFISFSHLIFALPTNLVDISIHLHNFLTILSFIIKCAWPSQLNIRVLM